MKYGIIGGTGVYGVKGESKEETVTTPYGDISFTTLIKGDNEFVFLPRHGKGHGVPPHKVNYRGNMWALKNYGVEGVYATAAVGSCSEKFTIGDLVVFNDFLDFTKSRPLTYYDGEDGVAHVSMMDPYCSQLREKVLNNTQLLIAGEGVYVCTEGPRFETAAEIRFYNQIGGHVVGMTNVPEVVLAKELGLCYAGVGIVTNMCTGMIGEEASGKEILDQVGDKKEKLTKLFIDIFEEGTLVKEACDCRKALIKL